MTSREALITAAYTNPSLLPEAEDAVLSTMNDLDQGQLRVASKVDGE